MSQKTADCLFDLKEDGACAISRLVGAKSDKSFEIALAGLVHDWCPDLLLGRSQAGSAKLLGVSSNAVSKRKPSVRSRLIKSLLKKRYSA